MTYKIRLEILEGNYTTQHEAKIKFTEASLSRITNN